MAAAAAGHRTVARMSVYPGLSAGIFPHIAGAHAGYSLELRDAELTALHFRHGVS